MCKLGVPVVETIKNNITNGWTCNEDFIHSWVAMLTLRWYCHSY
ncbi:MAG: hypothetical protein ACLTS6_20310 [Anaerobutyricum sp.]